MIGRSPYDEYLQLGRLLDAQSPLGPPDAHDELMFITVHQVAELWFKLLLHELRDARDLMLRGCPGPALTRLRRCHEVERVLIAQFRVLDTMSAHAFAEFRTALGTASGLQSVQFREIERVSADRGAGRGPARAADPPEDEPSLWDAYLGLLRRSGLDVSSPAGRLRSYARLAVHGPRGTDPGLHTLAELAESLVEHDHNWAVWRLSHALSVERQLGGAHGTGGTPGASFLRSRAQRRFYPELWRARTAPFLTPPPPLP